MFLSNQNGVAPYRKVGNIIPNRREIDTSPIGDLCSQNIKTASCGRALKAGNNTRLGWRSAQ